MIGNSIVIEVVEIRGDKIRLGITAPRETTIFREELLKKEAINGTDTADL